MVSDSAPLGPRLAAAVLLAAAAPLLATSDLLAQSPTTGGTEWYLNTPDECRLYVTEIGEGRPLVVLHGGWGAEHSYLLDAFEGLEDRHRLVFYDQRGSLRSPCPDSLVSVEAHVADLERLRQELGLDRMPLVGHSMGTFLGMSYLREHPDRVGGLVLLNAVVPRTPQSEEEAALYREEQGAFSAWTEREAVAAELDDEGLAGDLLSDREATHQWRIRFAAANIFHVDRWRQLKGGQVFYDSSAGRAAGRSMGDGWDFMAALREADFPITVINGDHDLVGFGGKLHRRLLDPLPNVEFVLLENAGHNAWIDAPEAHRAALLEALAKYEYEAAGRSPE